MPSSSQMSSPRLLRMPRRPASSKAWWTPSSTAKLPTGSPPPLLLLLLVAVGLLALLGSPTAQAVPVPMPFRRFFFLSNPPALLEQRSAAPAMAIDNDADDNDDVEVEQELLPAAAPPPSAAQSSRLQTLANVDRLLAAHIRIVDPAKEMRQQQQQQKQQQTASAPKPQSSRAALRGRVPMGPFDQWKRGGDFCGCNMGCFYHSVGQCASCCSLGL